MDGIILGFNELDLAILSVILLSGVFAYIRGFSWEVVHLLSWVLTLAAVWYLSWAISPWINTLLAVYAGWTLSPYIVIGVSGVVVFLGMLLLLGQLTGFVMKGSLSMQMGFFDRFLGFLYGAARGVLLMTAIFFVYAWLVAEENYPDLVRDAQFVAPLKELTDFIKSIFTNG